MWEISTQFSKILEKLARKLKAILLSLGTLKGKRYFVDKEIKITNTLYGNFIVIKVINLIVYCHFSWFQVLEFYLKEPHY